VVFFLGRFQSVMGPGLIFIVPVLQQMVRVDLRTRVFDVPAQDVISRDNVSPSSRWRTSSKPPASSRRPRCERYWASTTSTRCSPSASGAPR
jgi:hypothetical protein